jgi:hypothetical protein
MYQARSNVGIGWRQPHYRSLLEQGPALDFIEVHSENFFADGGAALSVLAQGRARYPVSLHGVGLSLGSASGVDPWHLDQLAQLVQRVDPVRVSDHASFARGLWRGQVVHAADLLPLPFHDEALDVLCANVAQVQERLQRPILVENIAAYVQWPAAQQGRVWEEPAFLNALAARSGCGLLVDVNNIYVNALNAPCDDPLAWCMAWLDAITPQAVGEIHLAGHCQVDDAEGRIAIDDHGSAVAAPVWQLYRHAVARFGAVPTLVEWDTDIPALDVLLAEAALARAIQQSQGQAVIA